MVYLVTQDRGKMYALNNKIFVYKQGYGGDKYELRISCGSFSEILGEFDNKELALDALRYIYSSLNDNCKVVLVPTDL